MRNNLQLVSSMLAEQLKHTSDPRGQSGLRGVQGRVTALAKAYDHLLGVGLSQKSILASIYNCCVKVELICRKTGRNPLR